MSGENDSDKITKKGLFIQHHTRRPYSVQFQFIDSDTVPLGGNEFNLKSKLKESDVSCTQIEELTIEIPQEKEQRHMRQCAIRYAEKFSEYAQILKKEKEFLKKKFPRKVKIPEVEITDWCLFCLGSRLYSKIYGEKQSEKPSKEVGHLPVLSIIVHLNQHKVLMVLKYLHDWFLNLGMEESLGMWVYALLACLNKPLDEYNEKFLERFHNSCEIHLKDCDEYEMYRLYRISAILEYFCLNSDKVGSTLVKNFM
ncbi:hypothetical protein AVEN_183738-1 [Araneus ventricosus]|uniref:Gem-associated protein 2 n=1 Tax=Araneus ventricosus TaxID=182803 RepID=A0A4Y2IY62_ARAVE|nr:hypothetical protein AVEN_183738-1 [Araneus ventricosus]